MIIENRIYKFKAEFAKELNIPTNQIDRRQDELLKWLANFFDYEFYEGKPKRILIKQVIGEYQPMPRKLPNQEKLTNQKKKDYEEYTIAALGMEYKPNSQSKIAREAILDFGFEKYSHHNTRAVVERYIKEPFKKYGETDNKKVWVWYKTYDPIDEETVSDWRHILTKHKIDETAAANAFYRQEQGEDITKEKNYYKNALNEFKLKYGEIPVLVRNWRLNKKIFGQKC